MQKLGNLLIVIGVVLTGYFVYEFVSQDRAQSQSLEEAIETIEQAQSEQAQSERAQSGKVQEGQPQKGQGTVSQAVAGSSSGSEAASPEAFKADDLQAFGTLEIPRLDRTLAIVEGADDNALKRGVGHMRETVYPGQGEQIVLSGHRDTVFRDFGQLQIGDQFIVAMPYGEYTYEIRETKIVPSDDTSVVGKMGEEVLVVSTCYPFNFIGYAPERFVVYAYPVGS